jgi:hypothetical protein
MPIKSTIAIDSDLMLEARDLVRRKRVRSFNALVEKALREELEKMRAEEIRAAIQEAASDPLFQADVAEISEAFRYADHEAELA